MKKRVTLVAVLTALLVLTVVGCSFKITERNIVGEWHSDSISIKGAKTFRYDAVFNKDGTGEMWETTKLDTWEQERPTDPKEITKFTWTLSGDKVTLKFSDGSELVGYSDEAAEIDFDFPDSQGNPMTISFHQN